MFVLVAALIERGDTVHNYINIQTRCIKKSWTYIGMLVVYQAKKECFRCRCTRDTFPTFLFLLNMNNTFSFSTFFASHNDAHRLQLICDKSACLFAIDYNCVCVCLCVWWWLRLSHVSNSFLTRHRNEICVCVCFTNTMNVINLLRNICMFM